MPRQDEGIFRERGIGGGHHEQRLQQLVQDNPGLGYVLVLEGSRTHGGQTYRRYSQWMYTGSGDIPAPATAGYPQAGSTAAGSQWVRSVQPKTTVEDLAGFMIHAERALYQWTRHSPRHPSFYGSNATSSDGRFDQTVQGGPRISGYYQFVPPDQFTIRTAFIDAGWI
jgi:hypothetical protein